MKKQLLVFLSSLMILASQAAFAVSGGEKGAAEYVPVDPPLVVNIADGNSFRFMQVSAQFKVSNAETATAINTHISAVRHSLLMLLGDQKIRDVYTTHGKEQLRKDCLKEVKKVMDSYTDTASIENIYFTSFIVQ